MNLTKAIFSFFLMGVLTTFLIAKVENWDTFSDAEVKTATKQENRFSNIIIIRPKDLKGTAINIYIDGEYVSSLLPGAYTEEKVCAGKHRVNLAYTDVTHRYIEKRRGGNLITFNPSEKRVYILTKKEGKLSFVYFPEKDLQKLLKKYNKRQAHTISRLNKHKCTQQKN